MSEHHYADPQTEAAVRAAQVATMTITVAHAVARVRQDRAVQLAIEDERATRAARADRIASYASARVAWSPALNDRWLQRAEASSLLAVWAPAVGWSSTDPAAKDVADRTEQRLAEMYPLAMQRYAQARAEGNDPATAMSEAAPCFAVTPRQATSETTVAQAIAVPAVRTQTYAPARRR